MSNEYENFEQILNKEEELLDSLTEKQAEFKVAVMEKNWEKLTSVINKINVQTDAFVELDSQREEIQYKGSCR